MKTKVSELAGFKLDYAVAMCEGYALREPVRARNEDVEHLPVPFKMYGVQTQVNVNEKSTHSTVEEVTVTRYGVVSEVRATAPTISFTDEKGIECWGTVKLFYLSREEAELECLVENVGSVYGFSPSTNWALGGEIIEREGISVDRDAVDWTAWTWARTRDAAEYVSSGDTPLIAAMRCFVVSKLGDEVEIPEDIA